MSKRLLLLTLDFPPRTGGVARYLEALAVFFGEEIRVIANPEKGSEVFDKIAPFQLERQELLFKKIWPHWLRSVLFLVKEQLNYQTVIISHLLPLGAAAWLAKFVTRRPYVVIVHGMDVSLAKNSVQKKWLAGLVLRGAKAVVANSSALAEEVRRDFGVKETLVVYPGVENQLRWLAADRPLTTATEGFDNFVLLTVSRLVARKGHLRVLQALSKIKSQVPNLQYRIVGEGPMKEELQKTTTDLGLDSIVKFEGFLSDEKLAEAYEQANLFVEPTVVDSIDREGFGMVYLEAAAHGVPSIATDQPGVDEAVLDGQTGLLIPDGDIEALAAAILALSRDPEERKRLGENARRRVLEEFVFEKQFEKLREFLKI
ncbi:MAG: glycosyltransferase family 4 protein [Candidatus Uhrbacteria bacterium]